MLGEKDNLLQSPYPDGFVERVRKEFPNYAALHWALSGGLGTINLAGELLLNASQFKMNANNVLAAFREGREVQAVKAAAEKCLRCKKLYKEWLEAYRNRPIDDQDKIKLISSEEECRWPYKEFPSP